VNADAAIPGVPVPAGRKGFKAELDGLRERMRGRGFSVDEMGALPGAVPCARLHTRQVLWEWGLQESADTTELLVSELVTNAVHITRAAAAGTPVRLWLVSDRAQVVIWVWDASPLPPARTDADGDAEHGRGLMLVQALSTKWGWDFPQGLGGKAVWAQLAALLQPTRIPHSHCVRSDGAASGTAGWPGGRRTGGLAGRIQAVVTGTPNRARHGSIPETVHDVLVRFWVQVGRSRRSRYSVVRPVSSRWMVCWPLLV
jgi:anti-sigma regulatory factor (Ser/Thr protein kinase)